MSENINFAVVDVETTGLFPKGNDRILEIAVIRMNERGEIVDEYHSLVNPHRDVGATHIHGITAKDVMNAPTFRDIAGNVLSLMKESVFVAHNASFDERFIRVETERIGYELPEFHCLCTMQLSRNVDPLIPSRRLGELCEHFGIRLKYSHSAYSDAFAASELLRACVEKLGGWSSLSLSKIGIEGKILGKQFWPDLPRNKMSCCREQINQSVLIEQSYIGKLISQLPSIGSIQPQLDDYLGHLDRILEDRRVTEEEFNELLSLTTEFGITREQANLAHQLYMQDLIGMALQDNILNEKEKEDLEEVRKLLAISRDDYEAWVEEAIKDKRQGNLKKIPEDNRMGDAQGRSICFTGEFNCKINGQPAQRSFAEKVAIEHGMIVKNGVTKKLDLLVVADPYSMSVKAQKARQYGTRIVAETVFWRMVGIPIE